MALNGACGGITLKVCPAFTIKDEGIELGEANTLNFIGAGVTATVSGNDANITVTGGGSGSGTVESVSVVSANGFKGTVASATTTPKITIDVSALSATKIGPGTVDNTEFGFLNGVTSSIQGQFSGKQGNLQYQNQGVDVGTSGGISTVNFAGPGVVASATGSVLTIRVSSAGGGSGTVQTVSIASANGFTGTSNGDPANPSLSLRTTVNGILIGDGSAVSAANTTGAGTIVLSTSATLITPTANNINLTNATNQIILDSDGTFTGTQTMAALGGNRAWTWPNVSGTVTVQGNTTTGTGALVLAANAAVSGATITASTINGVTLTTTGSAAKFLNEQGAYINVSAGNAGAGTVGAQIFQAATTAAVQSIIDASAKQNIIQYQDEGSNLGSAGAITTVNFTGGAVVASATGSTLTVRCSATGGGGGTPGGADTYVQFNDAGSFGGEADFTYIKSVPATSVGSLTLSYQSAGFSNIQAILDGNGLQATNGTSIAQISSEGLFGPIGASTMGALAPVTANVNTNAVGNVGAGTDDLMTYALPANAFSASGKGVRITASGTFANNINAKSITLNFGSTVILTNSLTTSLAGNWTIDARVYSTGSGTQDYVARLTTNGTAGAAVIDIERGTSTQTDSAAITIKCTGTATTNNDIVQEEFLIEMIN